MWPAASAGQGGGAGGDTGAWGAFVQAELLEGGFNGCDGGQHVAITDEAEVADAEDLALEVVLAAGQEDVKAILDLLAQALSIDPVGSHGGDGRAAAAFVGIEGQANGLHARLGGGPMAGMAGKDPLEALGLHHLQR